MTAAEAGARLNSLLAEAGFGSLDQELAARFADYLALILRWNRRVNLTAIRDEEGILRRHFVESIAAARALPPGIGSLLDFGSGAGFPGIPIALCRPEIEVTLAESVGKKAAFLREALRVLRVPASVHEGRAESLDRRFDCVTLRAVNRMKEAVSAAGQCVQLGGWLALMTTRKDLPELEASAGDRFRWESDPIGLPGADERILAIGQKLAG